jgi:hypothetical protein
MKKIILGLLIGLGLGMAGSSYAMIMSVVSPSMTPTQQAEVGNVYDIYTGQKLSSVIPVSEEDQIQALESRVSVLESKCK